MSWVTNILPGLATPQPMAMPRERKRDILFNFFFGASERPTQEITISDPSNFRHIRTDYQKIQDFAAVITKQENVTQEGVFRLQGRESQIKLLDNGAVNFENFSVHDVAVAFKRVLRNRSPKLLQPFLSMSEISKAAVKKTISDLPKDEQMLFEVVFKTLCAVAKKQETNKMTPQNIALAIAPSLSDEFLWVKTQEIIVFILNNPKLFSNVVNQG